jgi:hypothetical protein
MIGSAGKFSGTGAFCFHDIDRVRPPFHSTFTLNVPPDGVPFFSIDCVPVDVRDRIFFAFKNPDADMFLSLEGTVEDKDDGEFWISSKRLFIKSDATCSANSTIRIWKKTCGDTPVTMRCGLTNFRFIDWCFETDETGNRVGRGPVRVEIDGTFLKILKIGDPQKESSTGSAISPVTAEVVVSVPEGECHRWGGIIDDCAWLLTFAACEAVVVPYRKYYSGDCLVGIDYLSRSASPYSDTHPILRLDDPFDCSTKKFLESAYPRFRDYKDALWLGGVIHYFWAAQRPHTPLEAIIILQAVVIESLCNRTIKTFKEESGCIPIRTNEQFRERVSNALVAQGVRIDTQQLEAVVAVISNRSPHFEDKLRFTLNRFNVVLSDEEISLLARARNRLVHIGNFGNNADDEYVLQRYWMISNLLIRLLLSILNYHGPFNSRSPGYVKEILP